MSFIVGIDGPAGTGKSTLTKLISKEMNLVNIDTGATYRCVALKAINNNIKLEEKDKIIDLLDDINIEFKNEDNIQKVYLDGEDVTERIRENDVNNIVSPVSSIKEVRFKLVDLQRKLAEGKNAIMEGRDITTYVFPNADVKIYLDASMEERAKRRYNQNLEKGIETSYEDVYENIRARDENDKAKEVGALKIAEDAIVIDTTNLNIEEVKEKIIFPYYYNQNNELMRYSTEEFEKKFPNTCEYLRNFKEDLDKRKSDKSAKWFEYGRSQALRSSSNQKLLLSTVITDEVRTKILPASNIPYSGIYIIAIKDKTLEEAEEILKSKEFFSYIEGKGINASGNSLRITSKDINEYMF